MMDSIENLPLQVNSKPGTGDNILHKAKVSADFNPKKENSSSRSNH
jgi:hypothetical protein